MWELHMYACSGGFGGFGSTAATTTATGFGGFGTFGATTSTAPSTGFWFGPQTSSASPWVCGGIRMYPFKFKFNLIESAVYAIINSVS